MKVESKPKKNTRKLRPCDVFYGANVRGKFAQEIIEIALRIATIHRSFLQETMLRSSEWDEWHIPGGRVIRKPSLWGTRISVYVENEGARARILQEMGVDLGKSRIYRKYNYLQ